MLQYTARITSQDTTSPEDVLGTEHFRQLLGGEVTSQVKPVADDLELTKQTAINAEAGVTQALDDLDATKRSIGGEISDLLGRTDNINAELSTTKLNLEGAKTDITAALNKADAAEGAANDASAYARDVGGKLTDTNNKLTATNNKLTTATNDIADLSSRSLTHQQKEDLVDITDSLQVLRSGDNNTLEGLALQRLIALSGNGKDISAYLASNAMTAVLKAGITNFGTPQEREQVEITHQGTGHIGNLYFAGNQIDFRTGRDTDPYLSIGAEESQFIDNFISTARIDEQVVYVSNITLTSSKTSTQDTANIANDSTRLSITIDSIKIETYGGATTRLTLDGEVLDEWKGTISVSGRGGGGIVIDPQYSETPHTASNLYYERVVKAGSHTLRLEIVNAKDDSKATITGLRARQRYDTGAQQSALTKSGLRLFGSPDRYLDVDYRTAAPRYYNGKFLGYYPSPYTVRIKGGAKVDKLTADELDMPGVPLCGASFDASGSQVKAFGKYANKQGSSRAQAVYYDSGRFFRVYHSIGHTNYLPTVQVIDDNGNDINWNLTARIYAVNANDFAVRIITNGDNPIRHAFSFVAFKTM